MKKLCFILLIFVLPVIIKAQSLYFQTPVAIPNTTGYLWPRICLTNTNSFITWGSAFPFNLYGCRHSSGVFTSPLQLNPQNFGPYIQSWTGPEIASSGDTIFAVFTDENTQTAHVYVVRSFDGGVTFSDTIRVDNLTTDIPRFPNITVQPGGNPLINFLRFDANMSNQSYVVSRSLNGGNTFLPDVNATSILAAKPCDCCPGYIAADGNKVAVVFRNSVNNLRDFNVGISTDTANSFLTGAPVDTNGWFVGVCPSSGPSSIIKGDTLISVFMNGGSGDSRVYISTMHLTTQQIGIHKQIYSLPSPNNQNVPRLAGNGDTLAVVWDQTYNGGRMIMFSASTTGAASLGAVVDTISKGLSGFLSNPDMDYANGIFHLVFSNISTSEVMYATASFGNPQSVIENQNQQIEINAFAVSGKNEIQITASDIISKPVSVKLYSLNGKLVFESQLQSLEKKQNLLIGNPLREGVYILELDGSAFRKTIKLKF